MSHRTSNSLLPVAPSESSSTLPLSITSVEPTTKESSIFRDILCLFSPRKSASSKSDWELLGDIVFARFDTTQERCTESLWPNIVCALSNIFFTGLPALYFQWNHQWRGIMILLAIVSSTIYHLAEIKSRLPGLPYLRKHARWLIQIDRFFAAALMVEFVYSLIYDGINLAALAVGLAGMICGIISERHVGWQFVTWHSLWHNAAFLAVGMLRVERMVNYSTHYHYVM